MTLPLVSLVSFASPFPTLEPKTLATALRPVAISSSRAGCAARQWMSPGLRVQAQYVKQFLSPLAVQHLSAQVRDVRVAGLLHNLEPLAYCELLNSQ